MPVSTAPDHATLKEWIFARDILRRLGFLPEDLFLAVQPNPHGGTGVEVLLVLKTQGKQFNWGIGIIEDETADEDAWSDFYDKTMIPAWNVPQTAPGTLWKDDEFLASEAFSCRIGVMMDLVKRGFHLPGKTN